MVWVKGVFFGISVVSRNRHTYYYEALLPVSVDMLISSLK
jgi:hypothetical protein